MTFDTLVKLTGALPWFDLALLVQAGDGRREALRVQLSRWMASGKVIGLRRGMYALAPAYRRTRLVPAALANALYRPSYLSGLWALAFYDLIPERVAWLTSVTPRPSRRFANELGTFDYRNLDAERFWGYRPTTFGNAQVMVAEPEKALLDHWHLTPGEWSAERLSEMRYQHVETIDTALLERYAERFQSPRLRQAVSRWLEQCAQIEGDESL
jgi:predicted transcriptional regulator of viral defense system